MNIVFKRASIGCAECRLKHTKCDNASPSCGRCLRRGISCPGYRDVGGFVFKAETSHTLRAQRHSRRQKAISDTPILRYNLEFRYPDHFIAFFFDTYVFTGRRSDSSCGLLDHVSLFCRRASPSSTLVQATSLLGATAFVLSRRLDKEDFSWYHKIRLNAIKSIHHDIQCRKSRLHDHTLMAVLLLDFTEVIIRRHMGSKQPLSHQHGALTLLKLRGMLNFQSPEALSLYNAARYATLRGNARSVETVSTLQALDLLAKSHKIDQPPALRLLDILDNISALQCAIEGAISRGQSFSHLHSSVIETQVSLDAWEARLPANWLPRTASIEILTQNVIPSLIEHFESLDIAVVYNLWRCACLRMFRLHQVFGQTTLPQPQPDEGRAKQILDSFCRAVPVFLGSHHGHEFVEQDTERRVWKEARKHHSEPNTQRFPGDYLGKWFLLDLLNTLEQAIGDCNDLLPRLCVSSEMLTFLQEQKRVISDLSVSSTQQQARIFFECAPLI